MKQQIDTILPVAVDFAATGRFDVWRNHQRIILRGLKTDIRVGLHPWEMHRERPTRVIVDVDLFARCDHLGTDPSSIIDYDPIRALITRDWPQRAHTPLLETWVEDLVGFCFTLPLVEAVRVSVVKPQIFPEADAVGVEVFRLRPAAPAS